MNTFGSDLSKILSAREEAQSTRDISVNVPLTKAESIRKTVPEKTEPEETESEE